MKKNGNLTRLRERAEEFANKNPSAIKKMPPSDIRNLVEDLHIHQIELEMQNDELRRVQWKLEAARDKFSDLYDFAPVGYFTISEKGTILEANVPGAAMLGVERGSLRGEPFTLFVTRDTQDIFYLHHKKLLEAKSPRTCELKLKNKDNTEFHAQLECLVVEDNEGHLNCFAAVSNINERKQMEETLRESEEKYRSIFEKNNAIKWVIDPSSGEIIDANPAACKFYQYSHEEITNLRIWDINILGEAKLKKLLADAESDGKTEFIFKHRLASGEIRHVQVYTGYLETGGKKLLHSIIVDITDRLLAEEALRESEEQFRTVANFTHDWEYWIGPDGHHIYVSPSCERITGYGSEAFVNDPGLIEKIVHPDDHSIVVNHLHREHNLEKLPSFNFRIITRSGEERWISHVCQAVYGADGTYLGKRGSNRDITQHKQMEEELLKTKKLESLGVFAGGIAHDFNNLMSAVLGHISLARTEVQPGSEGFKNLIKAEKASIQTKDLTSRLITFSDGGGPVKETVPLCDLVRDSVVHSMKGSDIDARFSIPDNISPIKADEHQIRQVILNVVTNAREAMAGKGTIHVSCENTDTGVKDPVTLKDGKYVKISIEDQGPGIPEEDREKIFDPYFSTKEMGTQKGMGLGLAVSDSIVKQHDGLITVKSELGTGTILSIYLPASEKEIVEAAPAKEPVAEKPVTRSGKILVMDDEEMVRDVSAALLGHMGYEVEVAVDGVEAIEMYKGAMASGKAYDSVILDLTNSIGMGGVEAIKRLLQIDPDIKAIVTSGYCNDPVLIHFREYGFRGFITKPYMQKDLDEAIMDLF